jgi:hypothetical protein
MAILGRKEISSAIEFVSKGLRSQLEKFLLDKDEAI